MPPKAVTAFIVPQGKILDFVDGTLRNETPEEYVRQEIEKVAHTRVSLSQRGNCRRI